MAIIENVEAAQDFIGDLRSEDFAVDRSSVYAVTRCLEIISGASRRLDQELRERRPHIPWRQIANAGNVYRHDYESVSPGLIWATIHDSRPDILAVCREELMRSPDQT